MVRKVTVALIVDLTEANQQTLHELQYPFLRTLTLICSDILRYIQMPEIIQA